MVYEFILAIISVVAGAIAAIAGFGIGSLLTPFMAVKISIGLAVAGASIAHFFGTALRFFLLRRSINKAILLRFGLTSAVGGLIGAFFLGKFNNEILTVIFGCLLVLTGVMGITRLSTRIRFKGGGIWLAGAVSGFLGGLVGNQGSIRSSALLGFELDKDQFVATATGIALAVDIARIPVYLTLQSEELATIWHFILIATIAVVVGTFAGKITLNKLPESTFKKTVSIIILAVGILILIQR